MKKKSKKRKEKLGVYFKFIIEKGGNNNTCGFWYFYLLIENTPEGLKFILYIFDHIIISKVF